MLKTLKRQAAAIVHQVTTETFNLASLSQEAIERALEVPKKLEHGNLAFPVFALAKELRKAPPLIAKEMSAAVTAAVREKQLNELASCEPAGGFVNITFRDEYLQNLLIQSIANAGDRVGFSSEGAGRKLVIDYSSPNVAKPMHIGHLRASVIGQAIRNLAETQGYEVVGLNHLGDWGVQFGKLAWAFEQWGSEYDFANQPFESLYAMYVRFHDEAEKNKELDAAGSLVFKRLEEGDEKLTTLWKSFVEISMQEYSRIWKLLGVRHDLVRGESFYNDKMKAVEELLEQKGLLVKSEGAMVVNVGDEMPPCLIRKSDGASLYATRDLASAMYRHDVLKADLNLYVVGVDQTLHFKQVFKVLDLMGFDWAKNCHHVAFGMYRFKEGKMSTRKGRTIFLEEVLNQAVELVGRVIEEKNPNLADKKIVAEQVGVGAIVFNDLAVDRVRDVEFDWEKALSFEGDSGPYVQYTYVRCSSLLRKYQLAHRLTTEWPIVLRNPEERELIRLLLNYQDTLSAAFSTFRPNILAQYLLEVCGAFSRFYNKHRILNEPADVEAARMGLVENTRRVIGAGLKVLGIAAPDAM